VDLSDVVIDWNAATAIGTLLLAAATFVLATLAWRGIVENTKLISATTRQVDLNWENAAPVLIPERAEESRLTISYAAGTIPARSVTVWVELNGEIRTGSNDLLTATGNNVKVLDLVRSRAGSEPPREWDTWLRRNEPPATYRVVMRWLGPGDHLTTRAWRMSFERWQEVPETLGG
jgi:hypothetical protein